MCPVSDSHPTGASPGKRSASPDAPAAGEPLSGVRVLDLTQVVAGPYCTLMLADLGAEVVKVERPEVGDDMRSVGRSRDGRELYFYPLNRSKKSIVLDLKDTDERAVGHELAKRADVVVENFAPGTAARLAMGWEDLEPLNPRLIYCSLSGFGQTGPYRDRLAVDPIVQAVSGVMSVTGEHDRIPIQIGAPLGDVITGMFAAYAIVGYLHSVRADGRGHYIDVSMQAAMIAALGPRTGVTLQTGVVPPRVGNDNLIRVPANIYPTAEGGYVSISASNDAHWHGLCRALGREEWLADKRFKTMRGRIEHRSEVDRLVADRLAERPAAEWLPRLEAERVPFAPVNDYVQALDDGQVMHRGLIRTLQHAGLGSLKVLGAPWLVPGAETPMLPPPALGEHTGEVLSDWLGWNEAEIREFEAGRRGGGRRGAKDG